METLDSKKRKQIEKKIRAITRSMSIKEQDKSKRKLSEKELLVITEKLELLTHDLLKIVQELIALHTAERSTNHV